MFSDFSWEIDGWIMVTGSLCAAAASLLGNFLVLRKMSLMGDAISHAVLPGLAAAFLLTGSRASLPMFLGAAVVGVLTAVFTEWIRNAGRVDEGASMGVVFTALFAVGLLLIVQAADQVDLDPGCVLYGAIELAPLHQRTIAGIEAPQAVWVLSAVLLLNVVCVTMFYKELKLSSFDAALATSMGIDARAMHYLLMTLVAVTAVASFESVGNILVVAMFIVPPATARLLTDRLSTMIVLSVVLGASGAGLGHLGALAPKLYGGQATNTAGMMAVATGFLFFVALVASPRQGLIARQIQRWRLALSIATEDVLGQLIRADEARAGASVAAEALHGSVAAGRIAVALALRRLEATKRVVRTAEGYSLTAIGRQQAAELLRSHRLWESYMDRHFDLPLDHVHEPAERVEHYLGPDARRELAEQLQQPAIDPQGRAIPPESP